MELYKKYRPKRLNKLLGNKTTTKSIQAKIEQNKLPHALLLTGPKGCGKTTLGRIIARLLKAKDLDYKELDSGIFRGIDTVRDLRKEVMYRPINSPCKVVLIDECHMLGTGGSSMKNPAQNALLKILEDTPEHVYFILCTTDPQMLIKPVRSRCVNYHLNPLNDDDIEKLINNIAKKEGKEIPKEVIEQICLSAQGSARNALQILEKIIDLDKDDMEEGAKEEAQKNSQMIELSRALLKGESWKKVSGILKGIQNEDPEGIRRHLLAYMSKVLLGGQNNNAAAIMEEFEEPMYNIGFPGVVLNCYGIINGEE